MIKILIVDDHAIVREGLKQILSETTDIIAAGEANSGEEARGLLEKNKFDVILLDISMPGRGGLDVLKEIRILRPEQSVLILTMHPEEQYAIRALKAGASGYLTKDSASDELITAIRKISNGGKYISSSLAEKLAFALDIEIDKDLHATLSDREYQVLCMIASGKTAREIADEMSLSIKTISTYRGRILEKMRMKNNAELTHYAIKHKLVL